VPQCALFKTSQFPDVAKTYQIVLSRKDIIWGALTNGRQWVFLILRLNKEDLGGVYAHSDEFNLMDPISKEPSREAAKSLTYILTHWVGFLQTESIVFAKTFYI
jgi:hypothetical protein